MTDHDDKTLMSAVPPSRPKPVPAYPPRATKRGCGCFGWLLAGCLLMVAACGAVGVGGFVAYQMGWITPEKALDLLGLGLGDIEFDNFRDDTIQVSILQLDVGQDSSPIQANLEIKPFDVLTHRVQQPGRYRVDFGTTYGSADLGTCTLTIKSGEQYQFVPMPEKIIINRVNDPPSIGTDLLISTSALCR